MMTKAVIIGQQYIILLVSLSLNVVALAASEQPALIASPNHEELVTLGKQIYRQGFSSTNRPVTAIVQGDVPFKGTQFTCISCHRRSGMGAIEGDRIVPPVTGLALYHSSDWFWTDIENLTNNTLPSPNSNQRAFSPRLNYKKRPAYTDQTLAQAIRAGLD